MGEEIRSEERSLPRAAGRVIDGSFPEADREEARRVLLEYRDAGRATISALAGSGRVLEGIAILAEGSLEHLRHYVDRAHGDPRDILAWAFHSGPRRGSSSFGQPPGGHST